MSSATPLPFYIFFNLTVQNAEEFGRYLQAVPATQAGLDVRLLASTGDLVTPPEEGEGASADGAVGVLLRFGSKAQYEQWYHSKAYQKDVLPFRLQNSRTDVFAGFEGEAAPEAAADGPKPMYVYQNYTVADKARMDRYDAGVGASLKGVAIDFLGCTEAVVTPTETEGAGAAPGGRRVTLLRFASKAEFERWYASNEYAAVSPHRLAALSFNKFVAFEGI